MKKFLTFKEMNPLDEYDTDDHDTLNDFWLPALSCSEIFYRGVGYFSSSSFTKMIKGLQYFLKRRNAKIILVVGEIITNKDFEEIKIGYERKGLAKYKGVFERVESRLGNIIDEMDSHGRVSCDLLSTLIASDRLEIKIALTDEEGIFHKKIGYFRDIEGNEMTISGSDNMTSNALISNIEQFDVYTSWRGSDENRFDKKKKKVFDLVEQENFNKYRVFDFPKALLDKYFVTRGMDKDFSDLGAPGIFEPPKEPVEKLKKPCIPKELNNKDFEIHEHQKEAIHKWYSEGHKGILMHATGSGKTIASIYAATTIYDRIEKNGNSLGLMISVPYIDLADQWSDVLKIFQWNPVVCHSETNWKDILSSQVGAFNNGSINNICIVVTNSTMSTSELFKENIKSINKDNLMFIGDECHHHTTEAKKNAIPLESEYILGLSATPFHYRDEVKAATTREIYGDVSHVFTLKDAIEKGILSPFKYEVSQVYLTEDEMVQYRDLSRRIAAASGGENTASNDALNSLAAERSRLLTSSSNKIPALIEKIRDKDPSPFTLFYVGDGRVEDGDLAGEEVEESMRQISAVTRVLDRYKWTKSQFTANESRNERKSILKNFKSKMTEAIIAIRCLDEGIDIPLCNEAYLIASTRDRRQYIQRAGRLLRKSENKSEAIIHDFLMFPTVLEKDDMQENEINLIKNEINRARHFISHSNNPAEQIKIIDNWLDEYGLNYKSDELLQEDEY
jgi:superfamily II DNA or RNA helicase